MDFYRFKAVFACLLLLFACCQEGHPPETPSPRIQEPAVREGLHRLTLRGIPIYVDIAKTNEARQQGLMYIKSMPDDEGMLFVYPDADTRSFWMANTYIPLSLAYIDENGVIFQFVDMEPLDENSHPSEKPAQYVLEANRGWFEKNGIKTGDRIENLPSPEGAEQ